MQCSLRSREVKAREKGSAQSSALPIISLAMTCTACTSKDSIQVVTNLEALKLKHSNKAIGQAQCAERLGMKRNEPGHARKWLSSSET